MINPQICTPRSARLSGLISRSLPLLLSRPHLIFPLTRSAIADGYPWACLLTFIYCIAPRALGAEQRNLYDLFFFFISEERKKKTVDDGSVHSVSRSASVLSVSRPNRIDRLLDLTCQARRRPPKSSWSIRSQILQERPSELCMGAGSRARSSSFFTSPL